MRGAGARSGTSRTVVLGASSRTVVAVVVPVTIAVRRIVSVRVSVFMGMRV